MSKIIMIPKTQNPFEVIVNHKKYVYHAGTKQEVPDEVAAVIENQAELKPIPGGGNRFQSNWNQNDPSADDYIKNRTHYDTSENIKITFDGNPEGKEHIKFSDTTWLVKVSNQVPTTEEFMDSKVVIASGQPGAIEFYQMDELYEPNDMGNGLYFFEPYAMLATKDISMEGITLSKGSWFYLRILGDGSLEYISELSYTRAGELKKLDAKYLPDSIGRTYRFSGYSDSGNFIVESGDLLEFDEMLSNGLVDTGEVVNYAGDVPEVLRFVGMSFGDMGATYHFQKVWFDFDSMEVVGAEVGIGMSGNYYNQLSSSDSGAPA